MAMLSVEEGESEAKDREEVVSRRSRREATEGGDIAEAGEGKGSKTHRAEVRGLQRNLICESSDLSSERVKLVSFTVEKRKRGSKDVQMPKR
jgi:hypothetical protein